MDDKIRMETALIVDDDPVTRLLMRRALENQNLQIIEAQNGEEAIGRFVVYLPEITLLDVSLPDMDGFECCKKLRQLPRGQECAIVMVTALDRVEDIEAAFISGATDFMTKPLKWPLFSHRIRYTLKANQTLQELSQNKNKLEKAQEIAHLVCWEWDYQSAYIDCTDDLYRLLGLDDHRQEITFTNALRAVHPDDRLLFKNAVKAAIYQKQAYDIQYRIRRPDGQTQFVHERTDIKFEYGSWRIVGIMHDITSHKQSEQEIAYYAYYDTLTELPNRRLFIEQLETAVTIAKRHKHNLTLMFIDLDRFKNVNDTFGHQVGDELLCQASIRIKECIRNSDLIATAAKTRESKVARLAGDEFTVLLSQVEYADSVAEVAQRIIDSFATPFILGENQVVISVSIGIAMYPDDGHNVQKLLKHADVAMYHAKENGRNNYQFFSESMNNYLKLRIEMGNELRLALERNEFELFYQPQIDVTQSTIIGFEALLRWRHPKKGLLTPDLFIDVAESTGLILPIGDWVLQQACHQAKLWQDKYAMGYRVAVNLSTIQFNQNHLLDQLRKTLFNTRIPAKLLELELTETAILRDISETIPLLYSLKNIGIRLAINDFGTGYSSLNYLKKFPIDTLKIDRSFVAEILFNKKDAAIAQTIIQLADNLGLRVIAESIETEAQQKMLRDMGCNKFQGFFYSKPLPPAEVEQQLLNKQAAIMSE